MSSDTTTAELRSSIDRLDDQLHDLLIERTRLALDLQAAGAAPRAPNGEAESLRRLHARHHGSLPFGSVARIWRELTGAAAFLTEKLPIAVLASDERPGLSDLARAEFGSQVPILGYRVPGQVVQAVAEGAASAGVLPLPQDTDAEPWWRQILSHDPATPRIVARLPFAARGNARPGDAFAIARAGLDNQLGDRTLLAVEFAADTSRTRIAGSLAAAGFDGRILAIDTPEGVCLALADLAGEIGETDPRLADLAAQLGQPADCVHRLGSYAEPLARPADNLNTPIRAAS
jgi:chorismate mutase